MSKSNAVESKQSKLDDDEDTERDRRRSTASGIRVETVSRKKERLPNVSPDLGSKDSRPSSSLSKDKSDSEFVWEISDSVRLRNPTSKRVSSSPV